MDNLIGDLSRVGWSKSHGLNVRILTKVESEPEEEQGGNFQISTLAKGRKKSQTLL